MVLWPFLSYGFSIKYIHSFIHSSGKFIRLPNRIGKNRFGSENRIESKLFLPELECSTTDQLAGQVARRSTSIFTGREPLAATTTVYIGVESVHHGWTPARWLAAEEITLPPAPPADAAKAFIAPRRDICPPSDTCPEKNYICYLSARVRGCRLCFRHRAMVIRPTDRVNGVFSFFFFFQHLRLSFVVFTTKEISSSR